MAKKTIYLLLLGSLVFNIVYTSVVYAEETSATSVSGLALDKQKSQKSYQLGFDLSSVNYLSDSTYDHKQQQKAEVFWSQNYSGFFFAKTEGFFGSFSEDKSQYLAIPQAYFGVGQEDKAAVLVGRVRHSYNFVDSFYHTGLYNPYFTNDFVQYSEQGLTGVFVDLRSSSVGFKLGWTPLYIPNQEPQVHEDNGSLVSTNRWAQRPPPQFQFADQNHPIEYVIRDYKIADIVNNGGYVASLDLKSESTKSQAVVSYVYHPVNEIPLSRDTYGSAMDFVGHVMLSPVVTYHQVASVDLIQSWGLFTATLSYLQDQVNNKSASENETLQYLKPLNIYSAQILLDLSSVFDRKSEISITTAQVVGGEITDITQDGKESIFTFASQRTQFKNPVTVQFSHQFFVLQSKPLSAEFKWTYDRAYRASLVSTGFNLQATKKFYVNAGFDLLGVENEQKNSDASSDFISRNQANDRFYGGLQYVF